MIEQVNNDDESNDDEAPPELEPQSPAVQKGVQRSNANKHDVSFNIVFIRSYVEIVSFNLSICFLKYCSFNFLIVCFRLKDTTNFADNVGEMQVICVQTPNGTEQFIHLAPGQTIDGKFFFKTGFFNLGIFNLLNFF